VISIVAVTIAVTGTAVAEKMIDAGDIEKNAIKSRHLDNGKVKEKDLNAAVKAKLNRTGQPGPQGGTGPQGPAGQTGSQGPAGASALNPVPSGQTIRGAVGADDHAHDADASDFGIDVTMPMPAANPLSDDEVNVNVAGWQNAGGQTAPTTTDTNPGCNGTPANPTAPPGEVCIYVSGADHAFNLEGFSVLFGTEASPFGFKLKWDASLEGDTFVDATWAYTAP
jgi:hypothetical protein